MSDTSISATTTLPQEDVIVQRLNRISGQLNGIVKMYQDDRTCIDVVRQVIAARNALGSVARELLTDEASRCSREQKIDELELVLKELLR
jgi:DNA-binding FrmR family transcriptional regulator